MQQHIVLLISALVIPVIPFFIYPKLTKALLYDLRLLRILHYVSLSFLGAALCFKGHNEAFDILLRRENIFLLPVFALALSYAAVFAIVTNNLADIETDRISNQNRPLVQETVHKKQYLFAGIFSLACSLVISYFLGIEMFIGILAISLGYYVYSCMPFRLKRIPLFAKLIIGFNSLIVTVCGFLLVGGQWEQFPLEWLIFILVPLSLAANFIDLKDTAGDKSSGIKTLPVLWGEKKARLFITVATIVTYGMAACIVDIIYIYPVTALMALLHCYLLYKKPYNEKPVFLVYISALWGLTVILFFYKQLSAI